jgi:hypothetical protein
MDPLQAYVASSLPSHHLSSLSLTQTHLQLLLIAKMPGDRSTSAVKRKNTFPSSQVSTTKKQKTSAKVTKTLPGSTKSPTPPSTPQPPTLTPPPSQDAALIQHVTTRGGQQPSKTRKDKTSKRCRSLHQFPAGPYRDTVQKAYGLVRKHTLRTDAFPQNLYALANVAWKKARRQVEFTGDSESEVPEELDSKVCSHASFPTYRCFLPPVLIGSGLFALCRRPGQI